ncbi:MAG: carbon storage regulator [Candidatus Calescibacterium sp.]|nr:carbon storage regulator [Candidatus Calescibacterium sp.]MCX7734627.1 carbon storage regulator [bacterium]MDW8087023.1 carbon storage regulator [Candidatus Calescibacterium sp.]
MLVLKRKEGQSIVVGGNIIIKVHKIEGRSVKLAIEAPKEISILRTELIEKSVEKTKQSILGEDIKKFLEIGIKTTKSEEK